MEQINPNIYCETCGQGYRYSTRIAKCLRCEKEICIKCSPDHVCPDCKAMVPVKIKHFYEIFAFINKILLLVGQVTVIAGILLFGIFKIFFPNANDSVVWAFFIVGLAGFGISGLLVPILNNIWKSLPKIWKPKLSYY